MLKSNEKCVCMHARTELFLILSAHEPFVPVKTFKRWDICHPTRLNCPLFLTVNAFSSENTPTDSPVRLCFLLPVCISALLTSCCLGGGGLNSFIARYNFSSNCIDVTFVVFFALWTTSKNEIANVFHQNRERRGWWNLENCWTSTVVVRSSHLTTPASPGWTEVSPKGACY